MRLSQTIEANTARLTLDELRAFVVATEHLDGNTTVSVQADGNQRDPYVRLKVTL